MVKIEPTWGRILKDEFEKDYFLKLIHFVRQQYTTQVCYPPGPLIFNAFWQTPIDQVKVVILGQDPYHGPGQAHGLCFSVRDGIPFPPSLKNIFQEIHAETGAPVPATGDLTRWARQGVFLLNTCLTVRQHQAFSHSNQGWETFTEHIIKYLNENRPHLVFILWGRDARSKKPMIDQTKHYIIESAHPSPLSAYNGFFGSKPFSKCNNKLKEWGMEEIKW